MSQEQAETPQPLAGIKVVEFTHMVMGPTVGHILAGLGAEIVRVEPIGGDRTRRLLGSGSGYFPMYNRGKQSICLNLKDEDGLAAECEQGRDMGFDGKTLIHPAQVAIANQSFAPSEAEVDLARRQIAAFEEASAQGQGVAVVDGKIVENLHIVTAQHILAQAEAIAAFATE